MADAPQQSETQRKLEERWGKLGFDGLSQHEQEAIALFWLEGEVMNGGFEQFFANSSGNLSELVLSGLKRLGATLTLHQFQSAVNKLGAGEHLLSREARNHCLRHLTSDTFDSETRFIQDLPEQFFPMALTVLAAHYAASHA